MQKIIKLVKDFSLECREKNLVMLAASSSFFFFLCLIPLSLLLLSFAGFLFEQVSPSSFLQYIDSIIPESILPTFKKLFDHSDKMMKANQNLNSLHYMILGLSSIGFFGSIWRSVDIITETKSHGTMLRTFMSFLAIAISFAFILLLSAIPVALRFLHFLLELSWVKKLKLHVFLTENFQHYEFSGVNIISALSLFIFFIFFFKFFLRAKATIKATIVGSGVFTLSVVVAKFVFFQYLLIIKENLINNYGQLYSIMIFILWVFALILLFYMAIIFTYVLSRQHFELLEDSAE